MKKVLKKNLCIMLIFAFIFILFAPLQVHASLLNPAIHTITGTVFIDHNRNGRIDPVIDLPASNTYVELFNSLADAQARRNPVRRVRTNAVGLYSFTGLRRGTYFLRLVDNPATHLGATGIQQVNVTALNLVSWVDFLTHHQTDLNMLVFQDLNGNGVREANENIINNRTVILINLTRLQDDIDSGALGNINAGTLLISAITTGSLDLGESIHFRTTRNGQHATFDDVRPGLYVMIRSPFNLTGG